MYFYVNVLAKDYKLSFEHMLWISGLLPAVLIAPFLFPSLHLYFSATALTGCFKVYFWATSGNPCVCLASSQQDTWPCPTGLCLLSLSLLVI